MAFRRLLTDWKNVMPLTSKGKEILRNMKSTYGSKKKAESVFYASKNAGKISGVDKSRKKK